MAKSAYGHDNCYFLCDCFKSKNSFMAPNRSFKGLADRSKVSVSEPFEIEDLHRKFPHLSHDIVKNAIISHGPSRKKVEDHLNSLSKKSIK